MTLDHVQTTNNQTVVSKNLQHLTALTLVLAGASHRFDHLIERDDMLPIAPKRERSGVDRLDRSERVALDTRHLDETSNGIAGHAEMVLHRDLSGIFDLRIDRKSTRLNSSH